MKTDNYDKVKTRLFLVITISILAITAVLCGVTFSIQPLITMLIMLAILALICIFTPNHVLLSIDKTRNPHLYEEEDISK